VRTARLTAIAATLRLILESLFREELLLARRENELRRTVLTGEHLVFQWSNLQRFPGADSRGALNATRGGEFLYPAAAHAGYDVRSRNRSVIAPAAAAARLRRDT
jgi:hypothetical protein